MKKKIERVDLSKEQIESALAQAKAALPPQVFHVLELVVRAYLNLVGLLEAGRTTIKRLQRMLFGPTSETTQHVLAQVKKELKQASVAAGRGGNRRKRRGHGRNGQAAYRGATIVNVPHQKFKPGDPCPGCHRAKLFDQRDDPGVLVRVVGQAPLQATIYHTQKLRCPLCGEIFEAEPPPGVGKEKYDATSASMIGIFKYGGGFPFNRLQKLQRTMGIPLPASTQWEIVRDAEKKLRPVHEELVRQAAQGEVLHQDDTDMKILARMGRRREREEKGKGCGKKERTGIFTSGIVSKVGKWLIALFFTGIRHAGENLKAVLDLRQSGLGRPIQMCDALLRNMPKELKTILANCLAHARRKFVEVVHNFPDECLHVLNILKRVYWNDEVARRRGMTAQERLRFHQEKSGAPMEKLKSWMEEQLHKKKVEETSGLGEAMGYMIEHWGKLTLFLRKPGAPLDNNLVERALKKAILHRKNSLFYKTDNGARVGDVFMSLIHTCELNGVDAFAYLTELQRHAKEVRAHPEKWMPWNYPKATSSVRAV
jgi:hypothetical protein